VERCEDCGFAWETVPDTDIGPRVVGGAAALAEVLLTDPLPTERPRAGRWSSLEYAAHLRDVCLHVRDRVVITLVEDEPEFKPLYRDERVDLGLYAADDAGTVARELTGAAALFARTFGTLDPSQLARTGVYAYPTPRSRAVRWMGQQVVHEAEHHLGDVRADAAAR
jgi:hypothetical protein